jgi:hypothetical protein
MAVPLLIHLINVRRQQQIRWAAMQFLMESHRRNRRWILLKQFLLLAARMVVIGLLVLMLAHLVLRNEWMSLLGRGSTHHIVLLDDSYSMSDHWENTSALDEAKRAVQAIVDQAHRESDAQIITLLRFSEAVQLSAGTQPKVFNERINDAFRSRLESLLASWDVSQTDAGPADALKAVPRLPLADDEQNLVVYLVSDFRARQFDSATEVRNLLADLKEEKKIAQLHLISCVREERPNLAVQSLVAESGVRASGVEMQMSVTVANYGDTPARGVTVQLEQDGDALPALALDDIPPREELTHQFRVQFAGKGAHSLTASLPADAVELDNRCYFACDLPDAQPVLIIDGSRDGLGGRQLSLALAPGGNTRTGWQPHIEASSFLVDSERLSQQAAVCLLDVPRLSDEELASLEAYIVNGGGAAIFTGSETDRGFYNERMYRNGAGSFPVPLKLPTQLVDRSGTTEPDLEVTTHPLFQVLAGRRNSFLPLVLVDYYYAIDKDWTPTDGVNVIARLRNGEPLVVEKKFGKGRVIAQLTKLSSADTKLGRWSNWSVNRAFPVLANELISYLASSRQIDRLHRIGDDLVVTAPEGTYEPLMQFVVPGDGSSRGEVSVNATIVDGRLTAKLDDVMTSGIYEVLLQPAQGEAETRAYAVNVPPSEGDLGLVERSGLAQQLAGVDFQFHDAADMALDSQQLAGFHMSDALLAALVAMLLAEQFLAYRASYHATPLQGAGR